MRLPRAHGFNGAAASMSCRKVSEIEPFLRCLGLQWGRTRFDERAKAPSRNTDRATNIAPSIGAARFDEPRKGLNGQMPANSCWLLQWGRALR